jgi:LEA14-like dessication related protein
LQRLLAAFFSFVLLASSGCASVVGDTQLGGALKRFTPSVSFKTLTIRKIDFRQAEVDFVFSVQNPNPIEVKLASFRYGLAFEGQQVLSGSDPDGLSLKASGASEITLPMTLVYEDVYKLVKTTKGKDDVGFSLTGDFGFKTPIGPVKVPYESTGAFPVLRPPKVSLQKLKLLEKPTLSSPVVKAEILLSVENEGGSLISLRSIDYNVSLGNKPVSSGSLDRLPAVGAASTETVSLAVTMNLAGLGSALVSSLIAKKHQELALKLSLQVETPFGLLPLTLEKGQTLPLE